MTTELIFEWSTFNFIFIFSQTIVYSSLVLKRQGRIISLNACYGNTF